MEQGKKNENIDHRNQIRKQHLSALLSEETSTKTKLWKLLYEEDSQDVLENLITIIKGTNQSLIDEFYQLKEENKELTPSPTPSSTHDATDDEEESKDDEKGGEEEKKKALAP